MAAFLRWIVAFALSSALVPTASAQAPNQEQLFATCRSYDVPAAQAAAACQTLGLHTRKGENEPGKVIDWPKALWFHDRACTFNNAEGCYETGILYLRGKVGMSGNPPGPGYQSAFSYFRRACELEAFICFMEATMHETGKGTPKNPAMAESLYSRACTANKVGCGNYADFMLRRSDVKPDLARVAGLHRAACETGRIGSSCSSLAALIEQGKVAPAAPGEAAKLRQSACTLDKAQCQPGAALAAAKPAAAPAVKPAPAPAPAPKPAEKTDVFETCEKSTDKVAAAEACELAGSVLEMDMGDGSQFELAGKFHHRGCSLGRGSACRNLGTLFSFGDLGATGNPKVPNYKLALTYFRKACDLDPKECTWLGLSYERGEGVAINLAEAQRLFDKSCAAKDGSGCYYTARLRDKQGTGTPAQVFQLYAQGCDLDDTGACAEASKRHERGIGIKVDKKKAAALRKKACGNDYFKSLEKGFCPAEPANTPAKPKS